VRGEWGAESERHDHRRQRQHATSASFDNPQTGSTSPDGLRIRVEQIANRDSDTSVPCFEERTCRGLLGEDARRMEHKTTTLGYT
jgi:hypothetical protein